MNKYSLFLNKIYNRLFNDYFGKKINYDFPKDIMRWDLVNLVIEKKNYKSYLEIGCDKDLLFSKIKNIDKKIGVDPVSGGNFRGTSDKFFFQNKERFDCIFIDGLHTYNQVKLDILNSVDVLNDDGTIFVHDCLPVNFYQQAVPRCKVLWTGDVWRSIVELRTFKNLDVCVCEIDLGVGVIKKRKNSDRLNLSNVNFSKLKFEEYYKNYKEFMRITTFENILKFINS